MESEVSKLIHSTLLKLAKRDNQYEIVNDLKKERRKYIESIKKRIKGNKKMNGIINKIEETFIDTNQATKLLNSGEVSNIIYSEQSTKKDFNNFVNSMYNEIKTFFDQD